MKANEDKSTQVTFATKKDNCPAVTLNGKQLKREERLGRRMTWQKHVVKRKQLTLKVRQMFWKACGQSQIIENKLFVYKIITKPIWTYGTQLWESASDSSITIVQRYQNKILRLMSWYVPSIVLNNELSIPSVEE